MRRAVAHCVCIFTDKQAKGMSAAIGSRLLQGVKFEGDSPSWLARHRTAEPEQGFSEQID